MGAKEYLRQIKKIETMLENKAFEEKRLKELELPIGKVLEEKTNLQIERAKIIKTIEQLPEAEYDVLYKIYVQNETLYEVAADRKISYSLVTTIHGRALKKIDDLITTVA